MRIVNVNLLLTMKTPPPGLHDHCCGVITTIEVASLLCIFAYHVAHHLWSPEYGIVFAMYVS